MSKTNATQQALEDAIRALRDIAELDDTRPAKNPPEKVAERALERIATLTRTPALARPGRTARPDEDMFPMVEPAMRHTEAGLHRMPEGSKFYEGPLGTEIKRQA